MAAAAAAYRRSPLKGRKINTGESRRIQNARAAVAAYSGVRVGGRGRGCNQGGNVLLALWIFPSLCPHKVPGIVDTKDSRCYKFREKL